jgi:hypothetical protein
MSVDLPTKLKIFKWLFQLHIYPFVNFIIVDKIVNINHEFKKTIKNQIIIPDRVVF